MCIWFIQSNPPFLHTLLCVRTHTHTHTHTHASQDTLDSVEALIKKHEDFEKSLEAQEEKVNAVDHFAQKLVAAEHYDTVAIANRRDGVLQRCVSL